MAQNALAVMTPHEADIFTEDRRKMIRDKFANGAPAPEFDLFIEVCRTLNLDPLQRQVYLIPRNSKDRDGKYIKTWTIQTSIDGYRAIADRTGAYAGSDDARFTDGEGGKPATATVTVWKIVQGIRCPFTATARYSEYVQDKSPMWGRMPHTMLAKCAEALALRKAFPEQLSGVYTDTEMDQAGIPEPPKPAPIVRVDNRTVDTSTGEVIDIEPAPAKESAPDPNARTPGGASVRSLNYSLVLADEAGISADDIHRWCGDQFGKVSRNDLDQQQMSKLIDWLKELKETQIDTAVDRVAAEIVDLNRGENGEIVSWTHFWQEARALGVANAAQYEARVGAKQTAYASPAAALAALKGAEQQQ